jgi:hypothetical protein
MQVDWGMKIAGIVCAASLTFMAGVAGAGPEQAGPLLHIVSATYGAPGSSRARDFSESLQATCGDQSVSCESFCSKTLVKSAQRWPGLPFHGQPVCRVVYRCGEGVTRATEAETGDLITMNCSRER